VLIWTFILSSIALGQEVSPPEDLRVGVRGIGEVWSDTGIGTVYGSGGGFASLAVSRTVWGPVGLDLEISYRRMQHGLDVEQLSSTNFSANPALTLTPVVALVEYRHGLGSSASLFAGTGLAVVNFAEQHAPNESGVGMTSGSRIAVEVRAGMRADTRLIRSKMAPATSIAKGVDFEGYLGRRVQRSSVDGLNLNAWRVGLGLAFRL
jgi:opacity protein-like surface antigen